MNDAAPIDRPADAGAGNWVDRFAPDPLKPFLRLIRADRPVGAWLLFIPCLWGAALALADGRIGPMQTLAHALLFAIGAIVMRGAGCAYNDIVDRDIDAKVARTAGRPIPAGQISVRVASAFVIGLSIVGLAVLLQFNLFTVGLGAASLALVAAYPFMKRITWWPQAWLGLTFNWGALVGYAAAAGELSASAGLIYAAGVSWTLGYDTIYAHQDKEDDALIGVRSAARALGSKTGAALSVFYGVTIAAFVAAGVAAQFGMYFFAGLLPAGIHLAMQIRRLDTADPAVCLRIFKSNRDAGLLLLLPLLLESFAANR